MSKITNLHKSEPVATGYGVLVAAVIAVLAAFHVHLTAEQRDALIGLGVAATPLIAWIRSVVTPTKK